MQRRPSRAAKKEPEVKTKTEFLPHLKTKKRFLLPQKRNGPSMTNQTMMMMTFLHLLRRIHPANCHQTTQRLCSNWLKKMTKSESNFFDVIVTQFFFPLYSSPK
jgi:hypothetical protein